LADDRLRNCVLRYGLDRSPRTLDGTCFVWPVEIAAGAGDGIRTLGSFEPRSASRKAENPFRNTTQANDQEEDAYRELPPGCLLPHSVLRYFISSHPSSCEPNPGPASKSAHTTWHRRTHQWASRVCWAGSRESVCTRTSAHRIAGKSRE